MKRSSSIIVLASLLLSTLSLAKTTPFNASFDDLTPLPASGALSPVGIYHGLNFSGFNVGPFGELNESTAGVLPHSNPNVGVVPISPGTITVKYAGSKTKSFSLSNFYYGCVLDDRNSVVGDAKACNITVKGYKAGSSSPVAIEMFSFIPFDPVDVMNPLAFGTFQSKFSGLQTAIFAISPSTLTSAVIDNLIGSTVS